MRTSTLFFPGDSCDWLVSDLFGLQQARSAEAERAIRARICLLSKGMKQNRSYDLTGLAG